MFLGISCYSNEIHLSIRLDYASKMNEAFSWQAVGQSTIASAVFENGFQKARAAGENAKKLKHIRKLFVWYRTYGRYLELMEPPAHDYD